MLPPTASPAGLSLPLEDFSKLQQRYQLLPLAERARTVLEDAEPALAMADKILAALSSAGKIRQAAENVRKNPAISGKMRPSEAKNMLLDDSNDFIAATRHKLAAWRKTLERVASGEGIVIASQKEHISSHLPIAVAVSNLSSVGGYLSIVQLILADLAKIDHKHTPQHQADLTRIRRCATFLSDCDLASAISTQVN